MRRGEERRKKKRYGRKKAVTIYLEQTKEQTNHNKKNLGYPLQSTHYSLAKSTLPTWYFSQIYVKKRGKS